MNRTLSRRPVSRTPPKVSELLRGRIARLVQTSIKHSGEGQHRPHTAAQPLCGTQTFPTFSLQVHLCAYQDWRYGSSSNAQGNPYIFPATTIRLYSRSARSLFPLVSAGSTVIFLFYHITYTHTHRRTIQIQHVDLYDAYLLLFLIKIVLSSGIRTPRYALNMPEASFYP